MDASAPSDAPPAPFDEAASRREAKTAYSNALATLQAQGGLQSPVGRADCETEAAFTAARVHVSSDSPAALACALLWARYWHPRVLSPSCSPSFTASADSAAVSAVVAVMAAAQVASLEADRAAALQRCADAAAARDAPAPETAPAVFSRHQDREQASAAAAQAALATAAAAAVESDGGQSDGGQSGQSASASAVVLLLLEGPADTPAAVAAAEEARAAARGAPVLRRAVTVSETAGVEAIGTLVEGLPDLLAALA